jgi:hypothetical protein
MQTLPLRQKKPHYSLLGASKTLYAGNQRHLYDLGRFPVFRQNTTPKGDISTRSTLLEVYILHLGWSAEPTAFPMADPDAYDPGSMSQPTFPTLRPLLDNRSRRTGTANDEMALAFARSRFGELPHLTYSSIKHLQDTVFSILLGRLERSSITHPLLVSNVFQWALPKKYELSSICTATSKTNDSIGLQIFRRGNPFSKTP